MQQNLVQYGVVACFTFAAVISYSAGRDLRPSDHGLAYQRDNSSPAHRDGNKQNMLSFFGSSMPRPEVQTVGGGGDGGGGRDAWPSMPRSRDRRRDRVRLGLLAAAAICGFAGVALLVVSGLVYHLRRRREKAGAERLSLNLEVHEKELVAQP
ncbi:hypothetical protein SASPL_117062 [Salvia splendens]|uniref:Uncharacterized protein n=2 Tax=Salvia splendens TaxID=180675 RepID=A0A8X8XUA9_SALSN|nr:hypothetical protein SASPL_117062 [Salvia splendens]